jgi:hypothetical protein
MAFTLVEMLVVVSIIIIAATVIAPAFSRMIESTNYASAVNSVTATLGQARALAIQNGRDTGVAFLYDIERDVCTLVILELDSAGGGTMNCGLNRGGYRYADVMRPALNTTPVELPVGTVVCGLGVGTQIDSGNPICPLSRIDEQTAGWYAGMHIVHPNNTDVVITPWIFPRDDPRLYMDNGESVLPRDAIGADPWGELADDAEARRAVRHANSFYIRYSSTGTAVPITVADPDDAYIEWPELPYDRDAPEEGAFDDPACFDPEFVDDNISNPSANPEVWLRPVDQLAVVSTARLIEGTGIDRPWLVVPQETMAYSGGGFPSLPDYLNLLIGAEPRYRSDPRTVLLSDWIDTNGETLSFNRYTGTLLRRTTR